MKDPRPSIEIASDASSPFSLPSTPSSLPGTPSSLPSTPSSPQDRSSSLLSPIKRVAGDVLDGVTKEDSESFFARYIRNPIIRTVNHPVVVLAIRVYAVVSTLSVPPLAGVLVAAQASCISLDVSRKYRSSRLKERAGLMDKYEDLAKKREAAVKALIAKDPSKKDELEQRFLSKPENQEYEKLPRKDKRISRFKFLAPSAFEAGCGAVSDILSSGGIILAVNLCIGTIPAALGLCAKDKNGAIGSYTKRKSEIDKNDEIREQLIQRATALGMPSYQRSTVKLAEHMRELSKDVATLEQLVSEKGVSYSEVLFDQKRETVKVEALKPRSRFMTALVCLSQSLLGTQQDYRLGFTSENSRVSTGSDSPRTPKSGSPEVEMTEISRSSRSDVREMTQRIIEKHSVVNDQPLIPPRNQVQSPTEARKRQ